MAKVTLEEFITIWNDSKNVAEVCKRTGYTNSTVRSMASRYRQSGIDLKLFKPPNNQEKDNETGN